MNTDDMYERYCRARDECFKLGIGDDRLRLYLSYSCLMRLKANVHLCHYFATGKCEIWGVPYIATSGGEDVCDFVITT